jgi:hypothetical protein
MQAEQRLKIKNLAAGNFSSELVLLAELPLRAFQVIKTILFFVLESLLAFNLAHISLQG